MQQLLSACTSLQSPPEDRKSRRTLFVSEAYADAPLPKRRRSTDDIDERFPAKDDNFTSTETKKDCLIQELKQGSPEQKILLERKKQKELLDQQRNFQFEDERWKRIEKELDKAIPKPEPVNKELTNVFDNFHPSIGIQASLIADISPLKPLSHCVQNIPNGIQHVKTFSSPISNHGNTRPSTLVSGGVSNHSNTRPSTLVSGITTVHSPNNIKVLPVSQTNKPSVWKMSACSIPQNNQQLFFTIPQQQTPVNSQSQAHQGQVQLTGERTCFSNSMQSKTIQSHAVSLPLDIVNSLQGLIQTRNTQENQTTRPSMQSTKVYTPSISGVRPLLPGNNIQVTPILPKMAPQQLFTPLSSSTPASNTAYLNSEIAKKLVMPGDSSN